MFNHSNYDGFNDTFYSATAITATTLLTAPIKLTAGWTASMLAACNLPCTSVSRFPSRTRQPAVRPGLARTLPSLLI